MYRIALVLFFVLEVWSRGFAQQEKIRTVSNVRGEFVVVMAHSDITGREAAERARDDARRKAIEQVCGSRVNIWERLDVSSAGETFNSIAVNQIDGEIVSFEIREEGTRQSEIRPSETIFYCVADVRVKRGVSPDPDFVARVEGLRSVYFSGEKLAFTVEPSVDCWLKIFLFEDSRKGYMLYPNDYDRAEQLLRQEPVSFPRAMNFVVEKSVPARTETNRLVFVFTKSERPFPHVTTSREEIERWMALIPNNEKYIIFSAIEIRDR